MLARPGMLRLMQCSQDANDAEERCTEVANPAGRREWADPSGPPEVIMVPLRAWTMASIALAGLASRGCFQKPVIEQ